MMEYYTEKREKAEEQERYIASLEEENKRLREIALRIDKRIGFYFEKDKVLLERLVSLYHTTDEGEKEKKLLALIDLALNRGEEGGGE